MVKPSRDARRVNKSPRWRPITGMAQVDGTIPLAGYRMYIEAYDVLTLLRAERARVKRVVRKFQYRFIMASDGTDKPSKVRTYRAAADACEAILEALKR